MTIRTLPGAPQGGRRSGYHRQTALEQVYATYHRRSYVVPDPLAFLYDYPDLADREIVGLIASALAYGKVARIMVSVGDVLRRMGPSPADYVDHTPPERMRRHMVGFVHRFADAAAMAALLGAVRSVRCECGGLNTCFHGAIAPEDDTVIPALGRFVDFLQHFGAGGHLLPHPEKGSACKRLHLFLRWMVRCDDVDPGGWDAVAPAMLIIPLDVHMHRIGRALGFTRRRAADRRTALEVTAGFRAIVPEDPVKYDFSLTRLGIRPECDLDAFLSGLTECGRQ
ncbi:MAG: TIGR02757 family protein [Pseudomonadota bacterium]